jgi:hypothetical protein
VALRCRSSRRVACARRTARQRWRRVPHGWELDQRTSLAGALPSLVQSWRTPALPAFFSSARAAAGTNPPSTSLADGGGGAAQVTAGRAPRSSRPSDGHAPDATRPGSIAMRVAPQMDRRRVWAISTCPLRAALRHVYTLRFALTHGTAAIGTCRSRAGGNCARAPRGEAVGPGVEAALRPSAARQQPRTFLSDEAAAPRRGRCRAAGSGRRGA